MAVSAAANALTTKEVVKYAWGRKQADTEHDDRVQTLINLVSGRIESWCSRVFKETTYTDELYDGTAGYWLFLKQYPIITFTEIKLDDVVVDSDYYKTYDGPGKIFNAGKWLAGQQNYKVTYKAGYATANIPAALAEVCVAWVITLLEGRYKDAKIDQSDVSSPPDNIIMGLAPFKRMDF